MKKNYLTIFLAFFCMLQLSTLFAGPILTGAGATFPYPLYTKWADHYHTETDVALNYQPIGSVSGIKQIQDKTVDFVASDKPLSLEELDKNHLTQFPMVLGGVVPIINVPQIPNGKLIISGPVLADMYVGNIKTWNDPKITALNPTLTLPDTRITVVHRSDGSGTTFLFTNYLSKVSEAWKTNIGSETGIAWPTGIGGKGNEGVASYVEQIKGSIGYVEYAYAQKNKLSYVQLINKAGKVVSPSVDTFHDASINVPWTSSNQFNEILTDAPGNNSWPITGAAFILMQRIQDHPERALLVLKFFDWAYRNGKDTAKQMDYVALPDMLTDQIRDHWKNKIKDISGIAIWG